MKEELEYHAWNCPNNGRQVCFLSTNDNTSHGLCDTLIKAPSLTKKSKAQNEDSLTHSKIYLKIQLHFEAYIKWGVFEGNLIHLHAFAKN